MDNTTALSYLLKMGGTKDQNLIRISEEIWNYLISEGIMITAEHLPGKLNMRADWPSRYSKDFSEWKLLPQIFNQVCMKLGSLEIFASHLSHQLPHYYAWRPDPHSLATDAMQQTWSQKTLYAFPNFKSTEQIRERTNKSSRNTSMANSRLAPGVTTVISVSDSHSEKFKLVDQ